MSVSRSYADPVDTAAKISAYKEWIKTQPPDLVLGLKELENKIIAHVRNVGPDSVKELMYEILMAERRDRNAHK